MRKTISKKKKNMKKEDYKKISKPEYEIYTWYDKSTNGIFIQMILNKKINKSIINKIQKFLNKEFGKKYDIGYLKNVLSTNVYFVFGDYDKDKYTKKYWENDFIKKIEEEL